LAFSRENALTTNPGTQLKEAVMGTIQPKGEKVRQAVKWISSELQDDEKKSIPKLIRQAAQRFNLSPVEEDSLVSLYREKEGQAV
jgi:hypothetical protein